MKNENSIKLLTGASDISISIYALLYPVNVNGSTGKALQDSIIILYVVLFSVYLRTGQMLKSRSSRR